MKKYFSENPAQTLQIAKRFSKKLKKGDIVLLLGDLGAGKTHFVKGIALGLGCDQLVTSPTFTLLNVYTGGKWEIDHFDMYRLSDKEEALALGFDEYFDRQHMKGISIVEWPENVQGLVQKPYFEVNIQKTENGREIFIGRAK